MDPRKGRAAAFFGDDGDFLRRRLDTLIGTTLGAILTMGMSQQMSYQAMILSNGYAVGLGAPFLAIGLGMGQAVLNTRIGVQ